MASDKIFDLSRTSSLFWVKMCASFITLCSLGTSLNALDEAPLSTEDFLASEDLRSSKPSCASVFTRELRSPLELEISFPIFRVHPQRPLFDRIRIDSVDPTKSIAPPLETQSERREFLRFFKLEDLVVAPGHQSIRSKDTFDQLVYSFKTAGPQRRFYDPLLLNLIVREGELQSVDIWDGHHRFLALLVAGYKTLGELKNFSVMFLINGAPSTQNELWPHLLPKQKISHASIEQWGVGEHFDSVHSVYNVKFPGNISNFQLGSRLRLSGLKSLFKTSRKVAWLWPRSIEDITRVIENSQELSQWDEVLIIGSPLNLTQEEIKNLEKEIEKVKNLNITFHSQWKDKAQLEERIKELYSVSRVTDLSLE